MIATSTRGLAFTGTDLRAEVAFAAIALLAGLELQLIALAVSHRRRF
jgi:hypothetical protein